MKIPKNCSILLLTVLIQLLTANSIAAQSSFTNLVWSDEFNKPGLPDSTKWGYNNGTGCPQNCGWGNNELQYYTDRSKNAIVEDGVLKINALKEDFNGSAYTSTRLLSKGKYSFKYGKVEARAKVPSGVGTWPAIWLLGNDIEKVDWPACGEIDIMEHRGNELNKIFGTLHYPGRSGGNADGGTKTISNAASEFHLYALEWTSAAINIFVDGELYHSVTNNASIPFNHDFYLILNIAMGGNFGGKVDAAFTNGTMEIDYVRVYQ
jgi:beta-glucanase (GH16 family)